MNEHIESFILTKEEKLEISFSIMREAYGSNYYAEMTIDGLFHWQYHRD